MPKTFDSNVFLTKFSSGTSIIEYRANGRIFVQGDPADALLYIKEGKVKVSVVSKQGKEAVVAILKDGDFFGEGCLAGQQVRMATAVAISECSITKVNKPVVVVYFTKNHPLQTCSWLTSSHGTSKSRKIWSTSCLTPVRRGWPGCS